MTYGLKIESNFIQGITPIAQNESEKIENYEVLSYNFLLRNISISLIVVEIELWLRYLGPSIHLSIDRVRLIISFNAAHIRATTRKNDSEE